MERYIPIEKEIFHVHTYRCGHAEDADDYEYVERAIKLGAARIVFTDHAPFPGDPFGGRMSIESLPKYINEINKLKTRYEGDIQILCGLEIEYLPSFGEYYKLLKAMDDLDLLVLGQHFYEQESGLYSFCLENKSQVYVGLCDAIANGIRTGYFDVVAHPDRSFRKRKKWTENEQEAAMKIVNAAIDTGSSIYLEKNYSSMRQKNYYRPEFWELLDNYENIIYGYDAHSLKEIEEGWNINHAN